MKFVLFDKNMGNYNFSETLSNSTNLARLYQYSTLLQRNIIKYGKMTKNLQTSTGCVYNVEGSLNWTEKF